jgi:cell wall-associated NlpC family hydrolase
MRIFRLILIVHLLVLSSFALAVEQDATPAAAAPSVQEKDAGIASDLMMYALSLVGVNYKYGGISPASGLDCSGFVSHVFEHVASLPLPHNAQAISRAGKRIATAELRPGDLVFFNTLRKAFSHVGIYLGDNRFVHASSSSTGDVMISDMKDGYWARRFDGARRLLTSSSSAAAAE